MFGDAMTPLLHPHLVNDRFGDPALYVDCAFARRALQVDLGDLSALGPRKLLRISHIFVSHTHIDHFIGFDLLLRLSIGRDRTLRLFGPAGIIDQVGHRLAGYSWNLVERYATDLAFVVTEVHSAAAAEVATFRFQRRFACEGRGPLRLTEGLLTVAGGFQVRCAVLDHRIPCLGYAVQEDRHVNVWKNRLDELGLPVGPWLGALKRAVLDDEPDETPIRIPPQSGSGASARTMPLGALRRQVLRIVPGQKLGYVVDVAYTAENERRIVDLVRDADLLFIEAVFDAADTARAADRAHLTTAQAGHIARLAGARKVEPFHFSPRYEGEGARLMREVEAAFAGAPP
jgi:ribonuclease Z